MWEGGGGGLALEGQAAMWIDAPPALLPCGSGHWGCMAAAVVLAVAVVRDRCIIREGPAALSKPRISWNTRLWNTSNIGMYVPLSRGGAPGSGAIAGVGLQHCTCHVHVCVYVSVLRCDVFFRVLR
jgi:hypothetical protein